MFYRFTPDGRRKCIDLKDIYQGGSVFLCGGHPSLKEEPLELLKSPGIVTLAMNNTATIFKPDLWICADRSDCYSKSILTDPSIMKFARLCFHDNLIYGVSILNRKLWRQMPNTFFMGTSENFKCQHVLENNHLFAWWGHVFIMAIQLCHRLGFRKIYCAGTAFDIPDHKSYSYDFELTAEQKKYNIGTYNMALRHFIECLPYLKESGMEFISCTPNSRLNDHIPYMKFIDAVTTVASLIPSPDLKSLKHSSETGKKSANINNQ